MVLPRTHLESVHEFLQLDQLELELANELHIGSIPEEQAEAMTPRLEAALKTQEERIRGRVGLAHPATAALNTESEAAADDEQAAKAAVLAAARERAGLKAAANPAPKEQVPAEEEKRAAAASTQVEVEKEAQEEGEEAVAEEVAHGVSVAHKALRGSGCMSLNEEMRRTKHLQKVGEETEVQSEEQAADQNDAVQTELYRMKSNSDNLDKQRLEIVELQQSLMHESYAAESIQRHSEEQEHESMKITELQVSGNSLLPLVSCCG